MANPTERVSNFLVPATGGVNCLVVSREFIADPFRVNFQEYDLSGVPFRPYGVIVDNTSGANEIEIRINEIAYTIKCPAGQSIQMPYPSPVNHTASISSPAGANQATVIFVDYPVQPYSSAVSASGGGGASGATRGYLTSVQVGEGDPPTMIGAGALSVSVSAAQCTPGECLELAMEFSTPDGSGTAFSVIFIGPADVNGTIPLTPIFSGAELTGDITAEIPGNSGTAYAEFVIMQKDA